MSGGERRAGSAARVAVGHLWAEDAAAGGWTATPLDGEEVAVDDGTRLLRHGVDDSPIWLVVGPPALRVNGDPLAAGVRVLRDRDELRLGVRRLFFSTESLAVVEPFPGADRPVYCPRCKTEIVPGSPAVRCVKCRVWHHQSAETPCWTYSPTCALCDQCTDLEVGFSFVPEDL